MAAARSPLPPTLKLWDLETGNPLATFTADSDLFAVAVAANDRFVAGSHDGRPSILRLFDVTSRCAPGGA
jgi:hypothetical protein